MRQHPVNETTTWPRPGVHPPGLAPSRRHCAQPNTSATGQGSPRQTGQLRASSPFRALRVLCTVLFQGDLQPLTCFIHILLPNFAKVLFGAVQSAAKGTLGIALQCRIVQQVVDAAQRFASRFSSTSALIFFLRAAVDMVIAVTLQR